MKNLFALLIVLLSYYGSAQSTTVTYTATTDAIANPERGFYKHEETHPSGYDALNQSSLTNYRVNSKITLILRLFYLDDFVNSPISSTYLTNMQSDFAKVRAAGMKCVLRFAYSDDVDNGQPQDATKAQILAHIAQLKPILTANADVIATIQAGFIGTWGEWYYTDNFGMNPNMSDFNNRKEVVNALLGAIPANRTVQIRTPKLKRSMYNLTSAVTEAQAFSNTAIARTGHHNDCFLASDDDEGTYDNLGTDYAYMEQETKYLPMGGETCAVNEPRSLCPTALVELAKFHWSYANHGYHPGVLQDWQDGGCYSEVENRLGYRFELRNGIYPQTASIGSAMPVTIKIQNVGFATPYTPRTAYLVLRNTVTNLEYKIAINSDPRLWSAATLTTITESIQLPATILPGSYKLFLSLPDADAGLSTRPEYAIRMANNNVWEASTGYNNLNHTVTISSSLAIGDNESSKPQLTIYPVPTNNELVMEFPGISEYKVLVHNSLGQRIQLPTTEISSDEMTLDTQSLSNGVYFVSLEGNNTSETKRIIVSH